MCQEMVRLSVFMQCSASQRFYPFHSMCVRALCVCSVCLSVSLTVCVSIYVCLLVYLYVSGDGMSVGIHARQQQSTLLSIPLHGQHHQHLSLRLQVSSTIMFS